MRVTTAKKQTQTWCDYGCASRTKGIFSPRIRAPIAYLENKTDDEDDECRKTVVGDVISVSTTTKVLILAARRGARNGEFVLEEAKVVARAGHPVLQQRRRTTKNYFSNREKPLCDASRLAPLLRSGKEPICCLVHTP